MRYKDTKDCEKKKSTGRAAAEVLVGGEPLRLLSSSTFLGLK
jgi:hypothetical protein